MTENAHVESLLDSGVKGDIFSFLALADLWIENDMPESQQVQALQEVVRTDKSPSTVFWALISLERLIQTYSADE